MLHDLDDHDGIGGIVYQAAVLLLRCPQALVHILQFQDLVLELPDQSLIVFFEVNGFLSERLL
jgi:hypothetical protein